MIVARALSLSALCVATAILWGCQATPPRALTPYEGIVVFPDTPAVEIQAFTCLDAGWLEQIACSPGTREHESLLVVEAQPSDIHASLLLAGFQPGSPGRWSYESEILRFTAPTGDRLSVFVRYENATGETTEEPIRAWIQDHLGRAQFPDDPWVFGGSQFAVNPESMGPGEHYVADVTGSIIGLVTFGDEVIGFSRVWADQEALQPPEWQVRTDHVPPLDTSVTLILRSADGGAMSSHHDRTAASP